MAPLEDAMDLDGVEVFKEVRLADALCMSLELLLEEGEVFFTTERLLEERLPLWVRFDAARIGEDCRVVVLLAVVRGLVLILLEVVREREEDTAAALEDAVDLDADDDRLGWRRTCGAGLRGARRGWDEDCLETGFAVDFRLEDFLVAFCCVDLPDCLDGFDLVFFANADWLTSTSKNAVSRIKLIFFTLDLAVFIIHILSY